MRLAAKKQFRSNVNIANSILIAIFEPFAERLLQLYLQIIALDKLLLCN